MRILVTGTAGQVALSLQERAALRPQKHELILAGRPALDLTRWETIRAHVERVRPALIVNAAAFTGVDNAEDEFADAWSVNSGGPAALAAAVGATGARIVHLSTDYVFDGEGDAPVDETKRVAPLNAYGRTKLAGEERLRESRADYLILRTAWVYSPFGQNFVKTMLKFAEDRPSLKVVGDQIGSPTSALDLADGILTVADRWAEGSRVGVGETYHLAGSGKASWACLARHILTASALAGGPTAEIEEIASHDWPTRAVRPRWSVLDSGKFTRDFGYTMPDWRDSASKVVERLVRK